MTGPPPDLHGIVALVVEDNADLLDLMVHMLQWCGATVRAASTAEQALRVAREVLPHVVLTDIGLPDRDGYWLAEQLVVTGLKAIPVVAVTAFRPQRGVNLHRFRRWLMKPLEPAELCRVVAEVVRESLRWRHRPDHPAASAWYVPASGPLEPGSYVIFLDLHAEPGFATTIGFASPRRRPCPLR